MHKFLFVVVSMLLASFANAAPKAPAKPVDRTFKTTLELMTKVSRQGALLSLASKGTLMEDVRLMRSESRILKIKALQPIRIKKLSDKAISVSGLTGPIVFEKNGDEVIYRETTIRLSRENSFEKNYEIFRKKLARWHAFVWWAQPAFAQDSEAARAEAFQMAQLINLIYGYQMGKISPEDFETKKGDLLAAGVVGNAIINSVSCSPDKDGPNPDQVGEIVFNLEGGGKYTIKRSYDVKGKPIYMSAIQTKGARTIEFVEDSSVKSLFESMADKKNGGFCTTPEGNKLQMVGGAKLIQEGMFELSPVAYDPVTGVGQK